MQWLFGCHCYCITIQHFSDELTYTVPASGFTTTTPTTTIAETITINPTSASYNALGGNGFINIVASDNTTSWTAKSNITWVAITSEKQAVISLTFISPPSDIITSTISLYSLFCRTSFTNQLPGTGFRIKIYKIIFFTNIPAGFHRRFLDIPYFSLGLTGVI